jgi:hypothetical protein
MRQQKTFLAVLGIVALTALSATPALALSPPSNVASSPPTASASRGRAYLRVDLGRRKTWLGQNIPITISAQFQDVDGVTLEGVPQLKSDAIFTSDIARDPKQATQIVNGEPVLVATWTGTITPSTAGPLALSVELPVKIRFHDAAPQRVAREPEPDEDPFQSMMNIDPSDPSSIQRIFQSMQRSFPMALDEPLVGRAHDEAFTLKTNSRPLDVQALPTAGQPATFTGAVGHFELRAALSTQAAHANEPLMLNVTLVGDGDLDRVDLDGVPTSADWKTYPMSSKNEAPAIPGKKLGHRTFEQTLIPMHGGTLTIPSIHLPVFDPVSGHYNEVITVPLTVNVEGPVAAALPATPAVDATPTLNTNLVQAPAPSLPAPPPNALLDSPRKIGLRLAPVLLVLLGAVLLRLGWKRNPEKALHRALRSSAKQGSASAFFEAARRLIVAHFAKRWGVTESEVTADALRAQLGTDAEPLVAAISTSEALRFGRRNVEPIELGALCSSIEESLRKAA